MKLNIAYPANGTQVVREISAKDEQRVYGKKIGDQFDGNVISEEFGGCIMQVVGGNDFQGVPMSPKVATTKRVRLLLAKGDVGYRCRRKGVKKRKTVRGSIISNEIQVVELVVAQVPEGKEIPGLTDVVKDKSHFPKKVSKIRTICGIPDEIPDAKVPQYTLDLIKKNNPDAKIRRIKVTGIITDKEKERRKAVRAERAARKQNLENERREYNLKYPQVELK